jgi:hypothetical protein
VSTARARILCIAFRANDRTVLELVAVAIEPRATGGLLPLTLGMLFHLANVSGQPRGPSEDEILDADESPEEGRLPALRCDDWLGSVLFTFGTFLMSRLRVLENCRRYLLLPRRKLALRQLAKALAPIAPYFLQLTRDTPKDLC